MERRQFLETLVLGAVGGAAPGIASDDVTAVPAEECSASPQRLHPDAQTEPRGVDYYFLGNGRVTAVIQHASGDASSCGLTPLGLMLWDPYHFSRKWSTFTFHPEWGLKRGMVAVVAGDRTFSPDPAGLGVSRSYADGLPVVEARWKAGDLGVTERFWVAEDAPMLVREVVVDNPGPGQTVSLSTSLYANHALFTDYRTDQDAGALRADGYAHIELFTELSPRLADRFLTVDLGDIAAGGQGRTRLFYLIGLRREDVWEVPAEARRDTARRYYRGLALVETGHAGLDRLFLASRDGIHAVVSDEGRFDASVWQYNMEWTLDSSYTAMAAAHTGQFDRAASIVRNLLTRLTNRNGAAAQASRFHEGPTAEIGQNGALLGAVWTYAAWTGDLDLVRRHWERIVRVVEFPLSEPFRHESGLLQTDIEFFERTTGFGILPGFEAGYQSLLARGIGQAAELARLIGDDAHARQWAAASGRLLDAMLHHPTLSLVEDGAFIKRRALDGRRQLTLIPKEAGSDFIPPDMPLAREKAPKLEPDITTLYPILNHQIDPGGPVARATLDAVDELWNIYGMGGYGRYHPSGEPDSPGAWAFPTAIVARALAEAGREGEVRRALDWYLGVPGGAGNAFFEFYYTDTPRPVPPLPPTGIIVWAWAELASLFVEQMLGARPDFTGLRFSPRRVEGVDTVRGRLRYRDAWLDVTVRHTGEAPSARFEGAALRREGDAFILPLPARDGRVNIVL